MRVIRTFIGLLLILAIIGGVGYIGWTLYFTPGSFNLQSIFPPRTAAQDNTQNMQDGSMNMQGGHGSMQGGQINQTAGNALNITALQNRDKLGQIITTVNDALNQISIDPYSKVTIAGIANPNAQAQGNGAVNVYPNGNITVNVAPPAGTTPNIPPAAANTNQGTTNQPVVYDQGKLEQLHTGIYRIAQGMMLLNQLNDDLAYQASITETNPPDYQTYAARYNLTLQNRMKFNNAMNLINSATTLVNVNPYASPNGYQYNAQNMEQVHRGLYKLAQGMVMANGLSQDFTNQMVQSANAMNNAGLMSGMDMTGGLGSFFNLSNLPLIFSVVLIIMIIGLIVGMFGAISRMFRPRKTQ